MKPWLRWTLKVLLVYVLACIPDMWMLAKLGPPVSITTIVFILATSLAAPWVYLYRLIGGDFAYLPAIAPFVIVFSIGLAVVWWTERRRESGVRPQ